MRMETRTWRMPHPHSALHTHDSRIPAGAPFRRNRERGRHVAAVAIAIGADARSAATANAMRCGGAVTSIVPPRSAPPWMTTPSAVSRARSPACAGPRHYRDTVGLFTRSSAAPVSTVSPRAQAAATNSAGNSSIASGT